MHNSHTLVAYCWVSGAAVTHHPKQFTQAGGHGLFTQEAHVLFSLDIFTAIFRLVKFGCSLGQEFLTKGKD